MNPYSNILGGERGKTMTKVKMRSFEKKMTFKIIVLDSGKALRTNSNKIMCISFTKYFIPNIHSYVDKKIHHKNT